MLITRRTVIDGDRRKQACARKLQAYTGNTSAENVFKRFQVNITSYQGIKDW